MVEVGWVPSTNPGNSYNSWREMKVYSHYAYIVSEVQNSGIQIVDLQYLPDSVRYVGKFTLQGHTSTHSISQEGKYLYLNGSNTGFGDGTVIVDLTSPEQPVKRGSWNGLYVHDSRILNDTIWAANIYDSKVSVINAVNKDAPQLVTQWVNLPNSGPHNCAITQDRKYIFVTDEIGAYPRLMKIWDIQDLNNIIYVTNWQPTGITSSIVHNVEIFHNYAVVAHYTAGVRLIDISDPTQPNEVAWFDTYPSDNGNSYSGCWGVYMFPSGKIIASDRQTGLYVLRPTIEMFPPLNNFNLTYPSTSITVTTFPASGETANFSWDTSATGASYKWIFGNPVVPPRKITINSYSNSVAINLGDLDAILANLGVAPGDSLVGKWDVWAFRSNPNDSLKATNGPKDLILKRGIPKLNVFNLISPINNSRIVTSSINHSNVQFNWSKSGDGTSYKLRFGSPDISTTTLEFMANFDSTISFLNSDFDAILSSLGLTPGDSIQGQWAVWAYNGNDSLKSTQTFNITFKRQDKGDFIIMYDSTSTNARVSKDSIAGALSQFGYTYDLFNRGGQTSQNTLSLRDYKCVILLGQGTSVMSESQKDSIKTYLNSGGTTSSSKSKLIIFSEDIGYLFGRNGSSYQDLDFINNYLGWDYVADRPGSSSNGLIGSYINPGLADSTIGSWPDVFKKHNNPGAQQQDVLYLYRKFINNPDSAHAIGMYETKWNVATFGTDVRSIRNSIGGPSGGPVTRILRGAIDYVFDASNSNEPLNNPEIPTEYTLSQNYPNPFNPVTKINFSIPETGLVTLKVFDITGRNVETLLNEVKNPGFYSITFNASSLASGVYFYQIETASFVNTKRMVLLK